MENCYVCIDLRKIDELYYGIGKGNIQDAHLKSKDDSVKTKVDEKKERLKPIIEVIARNLTESAEFLAENPLIWKLGRNLRKVSPIHCTENFIPHYLCHFNLSGFDFQKEFGLDINEVLNIEK